MNEAPENDLHAICQEHLKASEARFRSVIERNADGIFVLSHSGITRYLNPAAERLFGSQAIEWIGCRLGVPVVANERIEVNLPRATEPDAVAEMYVAETEWEGEPALLATVRDITHRKRAEEALRKADRQKDELLAMLAHELRNPLAPIRNALYLMRPAEGTRPETESARVAAQRQVEHLVRMLDDLLDVSRISRGKIRLRKEVVLLDVIATRVAGAMKSLFQHHGLELLVSLPERPVLVEADPVRLEQALGNLLRNSAEYTPAGGRIWLTAETAAGEVILRVGDTGIGIPASLLPRVFDMFTQAEQSIDRSQGGLGIGLTLVKHLVEMHGGSVTVHSDGPGRGSEFMVRLPTLETLPDSVRAEEATSPTGPGRPLRILIVEDHRDSAETLAFLLSAWGHEVRIAHEGLSAAAAARACRPHVALLDIGLPGIDGYRVAQQLRQETPADELLLVAVTGYGSDDARRRSHEAGFDHHLVNPIDPDTLEALLTQVGIRAESSRAPS